MAVESEIRRGKGKCCSRACASALASLTRNQKGAKNNNWKGGFSRKDRQRRYNVRYPERHAAHLALTKAIRNGQLKRQPCDVCAELKVEGHHDDYANPLSVRWLCKRHHLQVHNGRFAR